MTRREVRIRVRALLTIGRATIADAEEALAEAREVMAR